MIENEEPEHTELIRSKEIDEIIGRPPHWLVQWGITVFFFVLILLFALSYMIKYPETVTVPFRITPDNLPVEVSLKKNGLLIKLFTNAGSMVHKNDTLICWAAENNHKKESIYLAPESGKVDFLFPISNGQKLSKNQPLFYITPYTTYSAVLYVKNDLIGKIKIQQRVILKFSRNSSQHTGSVIGDIVYISPVSDSRGHYIRVKLPLVAKTSKGIEGTYGDNLDGICQIIISKKKLLDKFLSSVNY